MEKVIFTSHFYTFGGRILNMGVVVLVLKTCCSACRLTSKRVSGIVKVNSYWEHVKFMHTIYRILVHYKNAVGLWRTYLHSAEFMKL
jgi:hypothetical protein